MGIEIIKRLSLFFFLVLKFKGIRGGGGVNPFLLLHDYYSVFGRSENAHLLLEFV